MRTKRFALLAVMLVALAALMSQSAAMAQGGPKVVPGAYMIVFNDSVANPADSANNVANRHGLKIRHVFSLTGNAFSANVPEGRVNGLRHDPRVQSVSAIPEVTLYASPEVTPDGLLRIDGLTGASGSTGAGVDVAVLDTASGLSLHSDLNVASFKDVTGENYVGDFHGHATHVAGTIAAIWNGQDVKGVASGVNLHMIKVFHSSEPTGTDVIAAGLIEVHDMNSTDLVEVVNMSLGIACDPPSACPNLGDSTDPSLMLFHDAIKLVVNDGTTIVVAAGNEATDANNVVPAGYDEVVTVSALTDTDGQPGGNGPSLRFPGSGKFNDDTFAKFSNYGSDVDIIGPGVNILSLDKNGGTTTMSGTSMASPHVAAVAAIIASNNVGATPAQIRQALIETGECANGSVHNGTGCSSEWKGDPDGTSVALNEPMVNAARAAAVSFGPPPTPNDTPVVSISSPTDGSNPASGASVSFVGTAIDTEEGDLSASLVWSSNIEGEIGTGAAFTAILSDGDHVITASATDNGSKTGSDAVNITVGTPPPPAVATDVVVDSVTYATEGGKNRDRHLLITISIKDNLGSAVSGASVSMEVALDGSPYGLGTGTTGSNGSITFSKKGAPSGTYTTEVTSVSAGSLTWDGDTPANSFIK